MKYLIIQLASVASSVDKKERLVFIPQSVVEAGFTGSKFSTDIVISLVPSSNFLTISGSEYEANKSNWDEYKSKLIAEKKAQLTPPEIEEEAK